jgi:hypothetical protein
LIQLNSASRRHGGLTPIYIPLSLLFDAKTGAAAGSAFLNRFRGMSVAWEIS